MTSRYLLRRSRYGLLAVVGLAACTLPNFEGPQVQDPPSGFLLQNDSFQQRRMFPDRDVTMHTAWIKAGNGPYSGIYVNAHPGDLTIDDVGEAQDAARRAAAHPATTFGEIEPLTIDGRTAWGWPERLETPDRGLDWVAYRTVVSYDSVSYAIEFHSGDPSLKRAAPDTLRRVVATFAVGRTEWNVPLIAVLFGATLLAATVARNRAKERAARLSTINLVQIPPEQRPPEDERPIVPSPRRPSAAPPMGGST